MSILRFHSTLKLSVALLVLSLAGAAAGSVRASAAGSTGTLPPTPAIEAFDLVSESAGWLLLDQRLYWTADGGLTWSDVTPPGLGLAALRAAAFVDAADGWLVLTAPDALDPEAGPLYSLARTADGGVTWQQTPLDLFAAGDPAALADRVFVQRLDAQTAWLVVKRATSRNFSVGTLFRTLDGGASWTRLTVPIGAPVHFDTPLTGWVAGGTAGDERYQTTDGGLTWQPAGPGPEAAAGLAGGLETYWATAEAGWAAAYTGNCEPAAPGVAPNCAAGAQLLGTGDGGRTWTPLTVPAGAPTEGPAEAAPAQAAAPEMPSAVGGRTRTVTGQALDACTLPSLAQLADWFKNSPYRVWNLYIGGAARGNCGTLTAGYIAELAVQGWRFIPTWVGPQAPCSGFAQRFSLDPAQASAQGAAEADAAVERAAALGLTLADKTGSVIYYDLEAYDTKNTACRAAAQAFIGGWAGQLRARGQLVGVYGATCTSALSDFAGASSVPDAVWAAYWLLPYQYRSTATVWDLPCLSNTLWTTHQRLRQYSGGHNETWGTTTLNIDSSVLDGPVADLRYNNQPAVNPLELYLSPDYAGADVCFVAQEGWLNVSSCAPSWDNQVSSLKLQANWSARVYRDANLGGPSVCYLLDDPDLTNERFDAVTPVEGNISSIKVFNNASCAEPLTPHLLYLPQVGR